MAPSTIRASAISTVLPSNQLAIVDTMREHRLLAAAKTLLASISFSSTYSSILSSSLSCSLLAPSSSSLKSSLSERLLDFFDNCINLFSSCLRLSSIALDNAMASRNSSSPSSSVSDNPPPALTTFLKSTPFLLGSLRVSTTFDFITAFASSSSSSDSSSQDWMGFLVFFLTRKSCGDERSLQLLPFPFLSKNFDTVADFICFRFSLCLLLSFSLTVSQLVSNSVKI
mmetsp:Transcript_6462/g.12172  ORF Transcript_6462/g.12172 Transcript_6462/m.12172 type:complete len:227 (-) Transcript_6462:154-834(-)